MPEVTDLQKVAQYVKSAQGAPSDVYNAACRLLDQPSQRPVGKTAFVVAGELERLRALLEGVQHTMREEVLARGKAEETIERVKAVRDGWYRRPYMSDHADELDVALDGPEDHGDGRTPQTLGLGEGQATTEAHGAVDVRPASMRRRVDFDTNGDPL